MTKKECAIVMAYTGITMLSGEDFRIYHRYIEDIMGRPIWTHELASESVVEEIKEKSRYDFLKLCESAKFVAPDDSSKIERSQLVDLFERFRKRVSKHQEKVLDEDMINTGTAEQILCIISIQLALIMWKLCEISNQLCSYYLSIKDYLYSIRKTMKEREHE